MDGKISGESIMSEDNKMSEENQMSEENKMSKESKMSEENKRSEESKTPEEGKIFEAGKAFEEAKDVRKEAGEILRQSLQCMLDGCPDGTKSRLETERLAEEINNLITVQGQGDNAVMGLFDVNLNQYATINIMALVSLLADKLGGIFDNNPEYSSLAAAVSVVAFVAAFLNLIQPRVSVELDRTDAGVYCALLERQKGRPVNERIAYEDVVKCIREVDGEADISRCLTHLQKKRLIRSVGDGFLVVREVKVKAV